MTKKRRNFCDINPLFYRISLIKEYLRRDIKDLTSKELFANTKDKSTDALPHILMGHRSVILRELLGVDMQLQRNKAINLSIAGDKINGIIIHPGETFSFWRTIGAPSARQGYLEGLVISKGKVASDIGGGLCQLANLIHWLVLHSPLTVAEIYHHTDALFPDSNRRVPFGTGTGVFYKNIDYRFKNNTDYDVQLLIWQQNGDLCGELRTDGIFPEKYKLVEENHHYRKEGEDFYRNSQVYRLVMDKERKVIRKELILNNHSKVMYDHSLIPAEQISQEELNPEYIM